METKQEEYVCNQAFIVNLPYGPEMKTHYLPLKVMRQNTSYCTATMLQHLPSRKMTLETKTSRDEVEWEKCE